MNGYCPLRHFSLQAVASTFLLCACGGTGTRPSLQEAPTPREEQVEDSPLRFAIHEGAFDNYFYQSKDSAAHVVLRSGDSPRIVTAFPAGNSGTAIWFEGKDVALNLMGELEEVVEEGKHGVRFIVKANTSRIQLRKALLGSIRVIRLQEYNRPIPTEADGTEPRIDERLLLWERLRADGKLGYTLRVETTEDVKITQEEDSVRLESAEDPSPIRLTVTALTGETALSPYPVSELFREDTPNKEMAKNVLRFLSYKEKWLAGSWRFLTYFGRDTLLTVRLLMPVLKPAAIEAAFGSVLHRMGPDGAVAHEEDIGDFAALRRNTSDIKKGAEPVYDYKMVDDDFILLPVFAEYLLRDAQGKERARDFLTRKDSKGNSYQTLMQRNVEKVLKTAEPYAKSGNYRDLIALKNEHEVGDWRDSNEGLGKGRYSFSVNASLVPAALRAIIDLVEAKLIETPSLGVAPIQTMEKQWKEASKHFLVTLKPEDALKRLRKFAKEEKLPSGKLSSLIREPIHLMALSLDRQGKTIDVMHSDDSFSLLFNEPTEEELKHILWRIASPFPAGLHTSIGLLVANPAYVKQPKLRAIFSRRHYHGMVVWSWQQAMILAGLRKQMKRSDLPQDTLRRLQAVEAELWKTVQSMQKTQNSELWTWAYEEKRGYRAIPFGSQSGDLNESNAAQLWSTAVPLRFSKRAPFNNRQRDPDNK